MRTYFIRLVVVTYVCAECAQTIEASSIEKLPREAYRCASVRMVVLVNKLRQ